ncbi:hypothetical protein COLO4_31857 [Corchorus olitorius]|uniref:Tr-type G domain-containing protein n=1 Tax=Corchorus olitorius TaxID=93759 RepID=A0A1R3H312_9ROSI|nr:hypothetical protein COLO4_31857 [Corchorus olitorius]
MKMFFEVGLMKTVSTFINPNLEEHFLRLLNLTNFYVIMDTPGHVDFSDEMTAALRLADGAVLIVDAAEGVMFVACISIMLLTLSSCEQLNTERAIRHAIQDHLPIVVVINKVDRLITELQLPPKDAYDKLRHTLEAINRICATAQIDADPAAGNVCFASASAGWSFTLQSFAKSYLKHSENANSFDAKKFSSSLWGDICYHPNTRTFETIPPTGGGERSFVEFVLEPIYKMYSPDLTGEERKSLGLELGVTLSNAAKLNVRPSLRQPCSFGSGSGFTNMLVQHIRLLDVDDNEVDSQLKDSIVEQ